MPSPTAGPGNQGPGRLAAVWRTAAVVTGGVALALQACVPGLGSPAAVAAAGSGQLTCFALDVSGSNLIAAGGEPPSDPGPVFVRQQVVELFSEILADLGQATGQQVGVVTFGTGPGTRLGPLAVSAPATRATLATALPGALRPSSAEAAWTDWVAGVSGCEQMFKRAGDPHGMVVLLTDGFPQGPAGDPAAQLAAIAPIARQLRADGITMQPVLYGAGAGQPGPARQDMTRLAALGHGHLTLAATPLDMLSAALSLASLSTGLPLGGSGFPVNGSTTVPLDVAPRVAAAVLVVLRSSSRLQISVDAPGGKTLASEGASIPGLGLVVPLTDPAPGSYQASADGQGSAFAAELLRYAAVAATPPSPSAAAAPHATGPGQDRNGSRSDSWLLGAVLALVALALAGLIGWRVTAGRRPAAPWSRGGDRSPACSTRRTSTGWCRSRTCSTRAANPPAGPSAGPAGPRSRSVPRVWSSSWPPARPGSCPPCPRPRSPGSPTAPTPPCSTNCRDGPRPSGPSPNTQRPT